MGNLAIALEAQGKLEEAETLAHDALAKRRKWFGNNHPQVAMSLNNLAGILSHAGKLRDAEAAAREALAIRRKILGNDHPDVPPAMVTLADILQFQGRNDEENELRREALALSRKGNADLDVATLQNHWAASLSEQEKWAEAEHAANEALAIHRKLLEGGHPSIVSSLGLLASALQKQGKYAEAEPLARECLDILEKNSPDDFLAFAARSMLGEILAGQMRYAEAQPLLLSGYEGMKQRSGATSTANPAQIGVALQRLTNLYSATGQTNQAAEWRHKFEEFQSAQTNRAEPAKL
jgi:hypothetical protein